MTGVASRSQLRQPLSLVVNGPSAQRHAQITIASDPASIVTTIGGRFVYVLEADPD